MKIIFQCNHRFRLNINKIMLYNLPFDWRFFLLHEQLIYFGEVAAAKEAAVRREGRGDRERSK